MAETTYNYDLQLDFPNQAVQPDVLTAEIQESSIVTSLVGVSVLIDDVDITFSDALSVPDKATLDAIVAAHQGEEFAPPVQRANSEGVSTNNTTSYQQKLALNSGPLPQGDYLITWYCEMSIDTLLEGTAVFAQIVYNGVERGFSSSDRTTYVSFSGSATVAVNSGDAPTLAINFRRAGGPLNTARVRRARISVAMLPPESGGGPS